ncbi:hypothetical protein CGLO_08492 [Colletotrichum gloeosporioides Cg-14]|uniref:Uncharacterized protein n=1 Tax=Colletotrichum gloeosporioides (strain Cg-14) TaxID=1237896 RepID=T0K8S0_COLGC|nr:hypothetical protein CGLO_08492 [Colletotrichum gloeosporioides Cg-14]
MGIFQMIFMIHLQSTWR